MDAFAEAFKCGDDKDSMMLPADKRLPPLVSVRSRIVSLTVLTVRHWRKSDAEV